MLLIAPDQAILTSPLFSSKKAPETIVSGTFTAKHIQIGTKENHRQSRWFLI